MQHMNIIQQIAIWALPLLFAITVHEVAHGYVAFKLGDPTAKRLGRLTLNPVKHIDPIGTIVVPLVLLVASGFQFAFGWAKPVPVTWTNLKSPRRDMALVAIAGPATNLVMAFGWGAIAKVAQLTGGPSHNFTLLLMLMGTAGILINLMLMILNLIPIPPLDGSRILSSLLPPKMALLLSRVEPYGLIILVVLIFSGLLRKVLVPSVFLVFGLIASFFGLR